MLSLSISISLFSPALITSNIKFRVPFNNRPLKTPRKLRALCIGAGLAGLTLAYKVSHDLKLEDVINFRIYELQVGHLFLSPIRKGEPYLFRNPADVHGWLTGILA